MRFKKQLGLAVAMISLCTFTATISAQDMWTLDNESSSLTFVTTKLDHIPEALSFKELSGTLHADGTANLSIAVDSLDALFEIRDERMKEHLFKMVDFPNISIGTQVDMEAIGAIPTGETASMAIETTMKLLGVEHAVPAEVLVTNFGEGLVISSSKPVLLNALPLGLEEGVAKLSELAGGIQISQAISVSFTLRFD